MTNEMTTDNMSNEEAIGILKGIVFNGFDRTTSKERQALDLAIKTLNTQESLEKKIEFLMNERHGKCKSCRHRDPEDKKCDCGGLERQGCPFPVSDDYFCKFYEKGGAV